MENIYLRLAQNPLTVICFPNKWNEKKYIHYGAINTSKAYQQILRCSLDF